MAKRDTTFATETLHVGYLERRNAGYRLITDRPATQWILLRPRFLSGSDAVINVY